MTDLVESLQLSHRGRCLLNIQRFDGDLTNEVALLIPVGRIVVHDKAVAGGGGAASLLIDLLLPPFSFGFGEGPAYDICCFTLLPWCAMLCHVLLLVTLGAFS